MYQKKINIPIEDSYLEGLLSLPVRAKSIVIFVHGHGHDRYETLNKHISRHLQQNGYGTILFDLLTPLRHEYNRVINNFDLLSERLSSLVLWLTNHADYTNLQLALFASGRGVPVALKTCISFDEILQTVVCAGGTQQMALDNLPNLSNPTFFLYGEHDQYGRQRNQIALLNQSSNTHTVVIPGTSNLFEEPGKVAILTRYVISWYHKYLPASIPEISLAGPILDDDATFSK